MPPPARAAKALSLALRALPALLVGTRALDARAHRAAAMVQASEWRVEEPSTTAAVTGGPSLFCFVVSMPSQVETLQFQLDTGMLTDCDAFAVYSNVSGEKLLGASYTRIYGLNSPSVAAVHGSMDVPSDPVSRSVLNAPIFKQVWPQVFHDGMHRKYDWTVKLDPYTVFFPKRLRAALQKHGNGKIKKTALSNSAYGCQNMFGPILVISHEAAQFLEQQWHLVLENPELREDNMMLQFMKGECQCEDPEPSLLWTSECNTSWSVPCRERVAMHPAKTPLDMAKKYTQMSSCDA